MNLFIRVINIIRSISCSIKIIYLLGFEFNLNKIIFNPNSIQEKCVECYRAGGVVF